LVAAAAAVATILVGLAFIGAGPTQIAPRLRTTFDVSNDPANVGRLATMRRSLRQFDRAPLREQLFGEGLATTGNTRKLVALPGTSTENYFLKLLLEVGAVGLLAVGGFIVWGVGVLTVVARRAKGDPGLQGACTAAFALATYGLAYPVLEPQVTAMTWWLLLAAAAAAYAERATRASAFVVLDEREYGSERPAVNLPAPVAVEADVTAPMHYR
jgi:O-antigen ligase